MVPSVALLWYRFKNVFVFALYWYGHIAECLPNIQYVYEEYYCKESSNTYGYTQFKKLIGEYLTTDYPVHAYDK